MVTAAVEISESIQQGIDDLIGFLPRLIGFLLILLIGYLVAKALEKIVALALEKQLRYPRASNKESMT